MLSFLSLPLQRQRAVYEQAAARLGILPESMEKDFWVSLILKTIFSHPSLGEAMTFKGGTSLSKGWHLIKRFSEDIDLVIDKGVLEGLNPEDYDNEGKSPSRSKIKKLSETGRNWVQEVFFSKLEQLLVPLLAGREWSLAVDPDVEDGMCLLFFYPSVWKSSKDHSYIRRCVKIEMGPQPDNWPHVSVLIAPMIFEEFPKLVSEEAFPVRTIEAHRTLWEKALLLHEIGNRADNPAHAHKMPRMRLSRHYYDLYCLLRSPFRSKALEDRSLFESIVRHRKTFFKVTGVDYSSMTPGRLNLMPHPSHMAIWVHDYEQMKETMFYDPRLPSFAELLETVKQFQNDFNKM